MVTFMDQSHPWRLSHRKRVLLALFIVLPSAIAAFEIGCKGGGDGFDDPMASHKDGGAGASDSPASAQAASSDDAGMADGGSRAADEPNVGRGKYLVNHIGTCGECHTPRTPAGAPDPKKYLSGVECLVKGDAGGCLNSANLTNDDTGLKKYTDVQIKKMFMEGKRPDGRNLHPTMPYWVFHNMTNEDADAVVAYLRTVTGIAHAVPPNSAPFDAVPAPAAPIPPAAIPGADGASAQRGRYLAAMAGRCLECHTPELPEGSERPIDMSKPFAGNRAFANVVVGGGQPMTVFSANITSRLVNGIGGWSADDIRKAIKQGRDRSNKGVCGPCPVGPAGPYGGMTDQDALDIAKYILGVPPDDTRVSGTCTGP